jgi:hypothetical protein
MRIFIFSLIVVMGCATYHFGKGARALPGGYDRVSVPMFVNKTQEVGIEPYFTEALRTEFERSKAAHVTSQVDAQLVIEGTIISVAYTPTIQINSQSTGLISPTGHQFYGPPPGPTAAPVLQPNTLPYTAVLNTQYQVVVTVRMNARKNSDHSILWTSDFTSQRQYLAPLLGLPALANGTPGINTAAPLYNQSSRVETIRLLARDMMSEAHDRITENF